MWFYNSICGNLRSPIWVEDDDTIITRAGDIKEADEDIARRLRRYGVIMVRRHIYDSETRKEWLAQAKKV